MICSNSRIDAEVTEIFLRTSSTLLTFNTIKSFGPSKYPVYVKFPCIRLFSQLFAAKNPQFSYMMF